MYNERQPKEPSFAPSRLSGERYRSIEAVDAVLWEGSDRYFEQSSRSTVSESYGVSSSSVLVAAAMHKGLSPRSSAKIMVHHGGTCKIRAEGGVECKAECLDSLPQEF